MSSTSGVDTFVVLPLFTRQKAYVSLLTRKNARRVRDPDNILGFSVPTLDNREIRQVRKLVSGGTRWRRWLDFFVSRIYDGYAHEVALLHDE